MAVLYFLLILHNLVDVVDDGKINPIQFSSHTFLLSLPSTMHTPLLKKNIDTEESRGRNKANLRGRKGKFFTVSATSLDTSSEHREGTIDYRSRSTQT